MPKRITHKEFIEKMKIKNPNIEILGEYINSRTKIKCRCKICNYIWYPISGGIKGCPECDKIKRTKILAKTHKKFIQELEKINPNIEILGEYINNNSKIRCRCKIDGYEWETRPRQLLSGNGCYKCWEAKNHKIQVKSHNEFIKEMDKINSEIIILSEYKNSYTHIKCKCKTCNHEWEVTPTHLLNKRSCPKCNESKGEKEISKVLNKYNIKYNMEYKFEDCKFYNTLPFDFYLPKHNICIEYDGKQHFEIIDYFGGFDRFVTQIIRDSIKNIYCRDNNIKLIRISYLDFNNIEEILVKELNLK